MKNIFIVLALMTSGAFANANGLGSALAKCTEHNAALDVDFSYTIYTDLMLESGKGFMISEVEGVSMAYNVDIKTTIDHGNVTIYASSETEYTTDVISFNLSKPFSGVRTTTLKAYPDREMKYPLTCQILE